MKKPIIGINKLRHKIDIIDRQILFLLNRRAKYALAIGKLKTKYGEKIYSPVREKKIITHLVKAHPSHLPKEAIVNIFQEILRSHRAIQNQKEKLGLQN